MTEYEGVKLPVLEKVGVKLPDTEMVGVNDIDEDNDAEIDGLNDVDDEAEKDPVTEVDCGEKRGGGGSLDKSLRYEHKTASTSNKATQTLAHLPGLPMSNPQVCNHAPTHTHTHKKAAHL